MAAAYDIGGTSATGHLQTWCIPESPGSGYYDFLYDPEGDVTQFLTPGWDPANQNYDKWTATYSSRGELLTETSTQSGSQAPPPQTVLSQASASGYMLPTGGSISSFDPRTAAGLGISYDPDGRLTTASTVYDALNRAYTTSYPVDYNFSAIPFQQANQTAWTIHSTADGEPLYTTDYQGNITDIKLSAYGEIFPFDSLWKGPVMYHRDMFGFTASAHTNASSSNNTGWTLPTPYSSCSASGNLGATPGQEAQKVPAIPQCLGACACIVGYQFRTDGYFDGSLTWRGVRNYTDSTQQWTTPDSYAGNAANPITGMTYNYGNNNPLRFSDPSGLTGVACDPPAPWDGHSPVESRAADCLPGEDGGDSGGGTSDGPSCSESSCMGYAGDNYLVNAGPLGSITLYRGVTAWELEDILKNSNYYRVGKGLEGKYFFETPGQVSKFAQARSAMGDNEGPFTLTSAVFNEPLNADVVELSAAEGGNALFLRGEPLETLSSNPVTVYASMPLPEVMPNIWEMPDVFIDL